MARNNSGRKNNNPEGRNQYSGSGWMESARERPYTAAAVTAAAVGAGVFLWSKRSMISDQISQLGDQISSWRDEMMAGDESGDQAADSGEPFMAKPARRSSRKSQSEIAEEALSLKETGQSTEPAVG